MSEAPEENTPRGAFENGLVTALATALVLGAVAWALGVQRTLSLGLYTEQFLAAMLGTALPLVYLRLPGRRGIPRARVPWWDWAAAAVAAGAAWYVAVRYASLVDLILMRPTEAVVVGTIIVLLSLEALRRTTGWALPIIVIAFLAYAVVAEYVPGVLSGRPTDWAKLAAYIAFDVNGILGIPLNVACTVVVAFILFGHLLSATGGANFFTELALVGMGRYRGGSAKIAVAASGLFGSISGSAVANVAATGVITIPMIKRGGYPAHKAGAIEAVASTGGQLLPPVMGAAAFLMAEFLNVPYGDVVLAALVPGILYYVALFIQADLEAAKGGIGRVDPADIPNKRSVLSGLYFIVPFAALIWALFALNWQPATAVLLSIGVLLATAVPLGYRGRRPSFGDILRALPRTGLAVLDIIVICTAAGMVIAVLQISGLSFNLTLGLVELGAGNPVILLLLAAGICIVLGMGLPTLGVYVLLAALVAPALVEVGISKMAAHLYVLYFGMMSMITPPIAIAAFAAAGIAGASAMQTGFAAVRFGWPAYVVPFLFVASPSLLLVGDPGEVVLAVITAVMGVWLVSIGLAGYFTRRMPMVLRAVFAVAGLMALVPSGAFPGAVYTDVGGALVGALLIAREMWTVRATRAAANPGE